MAQSNGGSIPPLGGGSAPVHKRAREESANDAGDCDEVRGHCSPAPTAEENRQAAINMFPYPDPEKVHACDECGKDVREVGYIRCAECVDPRAVDVCFDCFRKGAEPFQHKRTHAYRVVDTLQTSICTSDWTAAEELALIDHVSTQRMGTAQWEDLAMTDLFFRRRSASELKMRYIDTYLGRHGSVLPTHHLERRDNGTMEQVPIPLSDPSNCAPALRGVKVNSREIRERTIAQLKTLPGHRYPPSWRTLAMLEEEAKAAAAAATATAGNTAAAGTATAGNAAANTAAAGTAAAGTATAGTATAGTATAGTAAAGTATAGTAAAGTATAGTAAAGTATAGTAAAGTAAAATGTAAAGTATAGTATAATGTAATASATDTAASGLGSMAALGGGSGSGGGVGVEQGPGEGRDGATARAAEKTVEEREAEEAAAAAKALCTSRKRRRVEKIEKNREEQRSIKKWVGTLPGADLHAFHPLREDFVPEGDDRTPELLLEDMVFRPKDDPQERQIKLDVLGVSNHLLHEREVRKNFLVENNLLGSKEKPVASSRRKIPKERREIRANLRQMEPFSTPDEHDDLVDNLCLSKKLRAKLAELEAQRQNKVGNMAGGLEFELDKKKVREQEGGFSSAGLGYGGGGVQGRAAMDITGSTGIEFISQSEMDLCSRLQMLPPYYLRVKAALVEECAGAGFLQKKDLSRVSILDTGRLNEIFDFLVACGSVREQPNNGGSLG